MRGRRVRKEKAKKNHMSWQKTVAQEFGRRIIRGFEKNGQFAKCDCKWKNMKLNVKLN